MLLKCVAGSHAAGSPKARACIGKLLESVNGVPICNLNAARKAIDESGTELVLIFRDVDDCAGAATRSMGMDSWFGGMPKRAPAPAPARQVKEPRSPVKTKAKVAGKPVAKAVSKAAIEVNGASPSTEAAEPSSPVLPAGKTESERKPSPVPPSTFLTNPNANEQPPQSATAFAPEPEPEPVREEKRSSSDVQSAQQVPAKAALQGETSVKLTRLPFECWMPWGIRLDTEMRLRPPAKGSVAMRNEELRSCVGFVLCSINGVDVRSIEEAACATDEHADVELRLSKEPPDKPAAGNRWV